MRYLDFTNLEESKKIYDMLYDGLHGAGGYNGPGEIRMIDKVLTKLELLGEPLREVSPTFKAYSMVHPGIVALEDTEYNLLKSKIETVQWLIVNRRDVVRLYDFIDNAPTTEPAKQA